MDHMLTAVHVLSNEETEGNKSTHLHEEDYLAVMAKSDLHRWSPTLSVCMHSKRHVFSIYVILYTWFLEFLVDLKSCSRFVSHDVTSLHLNCLSPLHPHPTTPHKLECTLITSPTGLCVVHNDIIMSVL